MPAPPASIDPPPPGPSGPPVGPARLPAERALDAALLAYLLQHPQAADSAPGVARWWLGDDARWSPQQVQAALERLVARGALRRQRLGDGSDLYARSQARSPARSDIGPGSPDDPGSAPHDGPGDDPPRNDTTRSPRCPQS